VTHPVDHEDLLNKLTGGSSGAPELMWSFKTDRIGAAGTQATHTASRPFSTWLYVGQPAYGSAPGATARIPTRATAGALGQANPGAGKSKWLVAMHATGARYGSTGGSLFVLYDRLADISGLSGNSASEQSFSGLAVTRYTGTEAAGNQIILEVYTAIGTAEVSVTAKYTNQAGTSGQVTRTSNSVRLGAASGAWARNAGSAVFLPLAAGDTGVRSVESVTLASGTGTTGDFGVTIVRPIAYVQTGALGPGAMVQDFTTDGLVEVKTDACLFWVATHDQGSIQSIESALQFVDS